MVNWLTQIVYFRFHLFSKKCLSLFFIWSVCSPIEKCTQESTLVPIILNYQKIKQQLGDLVGSKNSKREKFIFLEKRQQAYLVEKDWETISAIWRTGTNDAENLGIVPILELTSDKESTMDQELAFCNKVYDKF